MSRAIAWINAAAAGDSEGRWGTPHQLGLPCDARGLLLAEGLFETVLVLDSQAQLLEAHLARWQRSAALLGLAPPPGQASVTPLLLEAMARSGIDTGALRLNWCRSSAPRGLLAPDPRHEQPDDYLFWLQLSPLTPSFEPVRVIISPTEVRQASSLLSRCKTFGYGSACIAKRQAAAAGVDDALLISSTGELCCGSSANLLVNGGDQWLTPPLTSGCLPGVMRQRALELGLAREQSLNPDCLDQGWRALLLNSLGCRAIASDLRGNPAEAPAATLRSEAERLWRRLLATTPTA